MIAPRIRLSFDVVFECAHHAITAAAIVGVTYLATVSGWLEVPDGVWLSALQRIKNIDASPRSDDHALPSIVIATIGAEVYTAEFEAVSPLKRTILAGHLKRLVGATPSAIAIDLDLVPPLCSAADELDAVLDGALSNGVQLFLLSPLGVGKNDEACGRQWMTARCESGVIFGYPEVQRSWGATLRYAEAYPSLGRVVREWHDDGGARFGHEVKGAAGESASGAAGRRALQERSELCPQLRSRLSLQTMRDLLWEAGQDGESVPIDMRVAFPCRELTQPLPCVVRERYGFHGAPVRVLSNRPWPASLSGQIVFLGGAYDPKDTVATSVGSVDGVMVHAAIARSDIKNAPHAQAYVVELVGGGALGLALAWLWRRLYRASGEYQHLVAGAAFSPRRAALPLASMVGWTVLIGAACLVFVGAVTLLSWRGLASGVWLSPVPMVLGMLIDTAVQASSRHSNHPADGDRRWQRAVFRTPALPLKFVIAVYSVLHLVSHAFEG